MPLTRCSIFALSSLVGADRSGPNCHAGVRNAHPQGRCTRSSGPGRCDGQIRALRRDLGRDDFSVFEDGIAQNIVAFSRATAATPVTQPSDLQAGPAPSPAPNQIRSDSPKRTYLICIDNLHSSFENFVRVRKALTKFFSDEQGGDSQYAADCARLEAPCCGGFHPGPRRLLAAMDSKTLLKTIQDSEARNLATETDRFVHVVGAWCGGCECTHPTRDLTGPTGGLGCPALKAQVRSDLFSFSERASALNQNFLQQLTQIVSVMSTMPTRRTVVFLSDGFNRFPGQELYSILKAYGVNDSSFKFNPHDLQPQLEALLKLAVRYDIRFYTIDSRGLYTGAEVPGTGLGADTEGRPSSVMHEEMSVAWFNVDAMSQLAKQTGGQFFENSNDLLKGIAGRSQTAAKSTFWGQSGLLGYPIVSLGYNFNKARSRFVWIRLTGISVCFLSSIFNWKLDLNQGTTSRIRLIFTRKLR